LPAFFVKKRQMKIKIGLGYDVHRLVENRKLIIGGVLIPYTKGLDGHSDADVLIHAICDALLGAAHLGDIGQLFPDNDPKYKNIDSRILLRKTVENVKNAGFIISNIDSVVVMQQPKIKSFIPQMEKNISDDLSINIEDVSVKATTTEKLGFEGREEGVSAIANCLLEKI